MNREDIIKLPKLDLHCHLDGSLSKVFLENTLGRNFTMEELSISMDCNSLVEYLEKFDVPLEAMNSRDNIKAATIDVMKSAADEGVRYIEIRFAPLLSISNSMNTRDVIEAVIEGLEEGRKLFNIYGNAICCAMTHHDIKDSMSMFKIAREYYCSGVAGLDLAGDEANHPIGEFKELFGFAKELGMNFTIHAGEAGPKSNIEGAIGREDIYPYSDYIKKGILATINTDNRLVSNTSITKEILFLQDKSMINDEEIVKGIKNAIEVSFASDEIKEMLWKEC